MPTNGSSPIVLGDPQVSPALCTQACNTALLDLTKDFNVFVFQDFSAPSSDVEGRVAAGRDVNIANYSVGTGLSADPTRSDIIAGRDVNFVSGDVPNGGVMYGGTFSGSGTSLAAPIRSQLISFSAAQVQIQGVSDSIARIVPNSTATIMSTGTRSFMDLTASLDQSVFSITTQQLADVHTLTIKGPSTATVIVNVVGSAASMSDFAMTYSGGITRNHILFNFNASTSLSMTEISVEGTVLAPKADVSFPTGMLNGQLIAHSFSGAGQFNYSPYTGCLPVVSSLNYFRDSFTDSTDNYALGGTQYEIYGVATKQVGDYVIVALNTNFPLAGANENGVTIGWGDFIMNFASDQSSFSQAIASTTFGVKFKNGTSSDSVNASLGVYQDVTAVGVEGAHSGWGSWGAYEDWVFSRGGTDPLLAGVANSYFDKNQMIPNSIGSGTFVSGTGYQLMDETQLAALGFDFPSGLHLPANQIGLYTFGFSFKKTDAMVGTYTGHLAMECANDVIAFPAKLEATCH